MLCVEHWKECGLRKDQEARDEIHREATSGVLGERCYVFLSPRAEALGDPANGEALRRNAS